MKKITIKQYQAIRIAIVIVMAIFFSQALYFKNFFIPIAALVVMSLVMLYLRRQVKGVVADERDYATGGKAALLAMQIYSWLAVCAMFIMYGLKGTNPAYEPIAMTLAFSTTILMLAYAAIFRYYDKFKLSDWKLIYTVIVLAIFAIMAIFTLRVMSGEDNWICDHGQWVRHGQPDFPAPTAECK